MRQICMTCQRTGQDSNILCTQQDCMSKIARIWGGGQLIGDVKILDLFHITPTASYYRAIREDLPVLLKIAHPGTEHRLQYEAQIFASIQIQRERRMRPNKLLNLLILPVILRRMNPVRDPYHNYPTLLPAYANASLLQYCYGMTSLEDEQVYYIVFEDFESVPLSDMLSAVPQPWYQHVIWIMSKITQIVAELHAYHKFSHLQLSPDSFFIKTDTKGVPHPVIVDLGLMREKTVSDRDMKWLSLYGIASYTSPELVKASIENRSRRTGIPPESQHTNINNQLQDVYGLGLLFYELLMGRPAFPRGYKTREEIYKDVLNKNNYPQGIIRKDLPVEDQHNLSQTIRLAIEYNPADRTPKQPIEFFHKINKIFRNASPPEYHMPLTFEMQMWRVGMVALVVVSMVILLFALLSPPA